MLDLTKRPIAPVREVSGIADLMERGVDLSPEETTAGLLEQAELDEAYVEAFAAYEKADEEFCIAFEAKTGRLPDGERATRDETAKERFQREGKGKPDDEDDKDTPKDTPPGQAKR